MREDPREVALACWYFIENVTDDDPDRQDKFFALRQRVRALGDPSATTPSRFNPEKVAREFVRCHLIGDINSELIGDLGRALIAAYEAGNLDGHMRGFADGTAEKKALLDGLRAIRARINGVWDDPTLKSYGPRLADLGEDIKRIIGQAMTEHGGVT